MTRISPLNIDAKLRTQPMAEGLSDAKRKLATFDREVLERRRSQLARIGETAGQVGAGAGAGRLLRGAAGFTSLAGLGGVGGLGAGFGAAGLGLLAGAIKRIDETQREVAQSVRAGTSPPELIRQGINPLLAPGIAEAARNNQGGFASSFGQTVGRTKLPEYFFRGARWLGGFVGQRIWQAYDDPGRFFSFEGLREGIAHGNLAASESYTEALNIASGSPYLRDYLRDLRTMRRQP